MSKYITATFRTPEALQHALLELERINVDKDQISIITKKDTHDNLTKFHEDVDVEHSAEEGATAGGLVGAILGGIITGTVATIPGVNVIVGGALAAGLLGAGAGALTGAVAGGLLGALGGYGVSEADAKIYEEEVMAGSTLLIIHPESKTQHEEVKAILGREDAYRLAA